MVVHPNESRGFVDHGWLKSAHTFSFANYYNPERMGFGALRVINDDFVEAGMGFGAHPHRDMEIISIPLEGALAHKDSTGTSKIIKKGEVQIMTAGRGIMHSEMNASSNEAVKFLQIWVHPKKIGVEPRYEQKEFLRVARQNKFCTVVSPDGREGSVSINQDAFFSMIDLDQGRSASYEKKMNGNGIYLFIIKGSGTLNGKTYRERDGIGLKEFTLITISAGENSEILLMEVPV